MFSFMFVRKIKRIKEYKGAEERGEKIFNGRMNYKLLLFLLFGVIMALITKTKCEGGEKKISKQIYTLKIHKK